MYTTNIFIREKVLCNRYLFSEDMKDFLNTPALQILTILNNKDMKWYKKKLPAIYAGSF